MNAVRCHNPVAADIDVTDNCFCTVFFAGLYLSSSFSKTAIIFHKNNEVLVNCEIGCKSTCSTISLFLRSLICTYSADDLRPLMYKDHLNEHLMFFAIFVLVVLIVDVFLSTEARGSYLDFFCPSLSTFGCLDVCLMLF